MSDIFDEKKDLKYLKSFVVKLRNNYQSFMHNCVRAEVSNIGVVERTNVDPEEIRLKNKLAISWPGDEIVGQIVKDTVRLIIDNNINPGDLL